jgi:hypothetical protein
MVDGSCIWFFNRPCGNVFKTSTAKVNKKNLKNLANNSPGYRKKLKPIIASSWVLRTGFIQQFSESWFSNAKAIHQNFLRR